MILIKDDNYIIESTPKRIISIKIEGIFEPEQVRIQKSIDKEGFIRKGLFRADSIIEEKSIIIVH
ncbi:MAG: hypothetical protein JJU02_08465 [Cryomorphaceae bacterium]|nr:hypothetical protein [Cryomorphaceae bacterium]